MGIDTTHYVVRKGEVRTDDVVELDGHWFEDCEFTDCTLVFRGIDMFGYANTKFERCRIELAEHALMSLAVIARFMPDVIGVDDLRGVLFSLISGKTTIN